MAFQDVDQRIVEAFAVGEDGSHEFGGIIEFEPGGLVSLDAVGGAMGFAKGVTMEACDQFPDCGDFEFGAAEFAGAVGEFGLDLSNDVDFAFAQSAAEDIGAAGGQSGKCFADLENVLFINDKAECTAQAGFKRRMRITNGTELLITTGELHLFAFVGCAWANDGNDGDEGIDVLNIAHFAEGDHGRTFDVMNGASGAARDQVPNSTVLPGFQSGEVDGRDGRFK